MKGEIYFTVTQLQDFFKNIIIMSLLAVSTQNPSLLLGRDPIA